MTLFYVILAFIVGLLIGWYLWGRLRGELDAMRASLDGIRSERDRSKIDATRLASELETCSRARGDLARQLDEHKAKSSAARLSRPLVSDPAKSHVPKKRSASANRTAATRASTATAQPTAKSSAKDNLRRLIGIGPVNERRLNEHGITTFAQIAGWTVADIKRVEEYLQFDGRIKRERWVQQAKLLAAGNEKEFKRRFPNAAGANNT